MTSAQALRQRLISLPELTALIPVDRIKFAQPTTIDKIPCIRIDSINTDFSICYDHQIANKSTTVQVSVFSDNLIKCEEISNIIFVGLFSSMKMNNKIYSFIPIDIAHMYDSETKYWIGIIRCNVWS